MKWIMIGVNSGMALNIIAVQMLWIAVLAVTLLRNRAAWQRITYAESH